MLELRDVSLFVGRGERIRPILADVRAVFPKRHFAAILGPSGCGKSTLLKAICGIAEGTEEGEIVWDGRDLAKDDFSPSEIAYVPQFGIAFDELTAEECVEFAVRLRVRGAKNDSLAEAVTNTLGEVGMLEFANRRVAVLSGGQRRRLALAMEIASAPAILLADEATTGLDAQAEDEIIGLLHELSQNGRLILSVTHSLRHVAVYDSVLVMHGGVVAYHGSPAHLMHYFRLDQIEDLYARLDERDPQQWARSWRKHSSPYVSEVLAMAADDEATVPSSELPVDPALDDSAPAERPIHEMHDSEIASAAADPAAADPAATDPSDEAEREGKQLVATVRVDEGGIEIEPIDEPAPAAVAPEERPTDTRPAAWSQVWTLFARRCLIFSRNRAQLLLQLGLIAGFPLLVAVFAWDGLPQVRNLSYGEPRGPFEQAIEANEFLKQATRVGSLVSGIVMFQVILLTLMGANNAGREIAAERLIFEKEKLAGLRSGSYVASKAAFVGLLVAAQSLWMGLFVHYVCGFPGALVPQIGFLLLANAAMSAVCLAISSWMGSAEQASLVSIYLVGFQLPLSGAVLALPDLFGAAVRPFIAAYWSWSGVLQSLRDERYYEIVTMVTQTALSPAALCVWVLVVHIAAGIFLAWAGCCRMRLR